ncbi:MAG: ribosome silencing factor [Oscillospiraceae bacterium]|jgi:ribosome-associated protein|nr:ribosome silencing factor [Oscillospiraceae bacterium]
MTDTEILQIAVRTLDEKLGKDIKVIRIRDVSSIANYFVLATGTSSTQVKTLADMVENKLSKSGTVPRRIEGYRGADWIVLDYIDVIVHIFYKDTREFYDLERLWQDGEAVDIGELLEADAERPGKVAL